MSLLNMLLIVLGPFVVIGLVWRVVVWFFEREQARS